MKKYIVNDLAVGGYFITEADDKKEAALKAINRIFDESSLLDLINNDIEIIDEEELEEI